MSFVGLDWGSGINQYAGILREAAQAREQQKQRDLQNQIQFAQAGALYGVPDPYGRMVENPFYLEEEAMMEDPTLAEPLAMGPAQQMPASRGMGMQAFQPGMGNFEVVDRGMGQPIEGASVDVVERDPAQDNPADYIDPKKFDRGPDIGDEYINALRKKRYLTLNENRSLQEAIKQKMARDAMNPYERALFEQMQVAAKVKSEEAQRVFEAQEAAKDRAAKGTKNPPRDTSALDRDRRAKSIRAGIPKQPTPPKMPQYPTRNLMRQYEAEMKNYNNSLKNWERIRDEKEQEALEILRGTGPITATNKAGKKEAQSGSKQASEKSFNDEQALINNLANTMISKDPNISRGKARSQAEAFLKNKGLIR